MWKDDITQHDFYKRDFENDTNLVATIYAGDTALEKLSVTIDNEDKVNVEVFGVKLTTKEAFEVFKNNNELSFKILQTQLIEKAEDESILFNKKLLFMALKIIRTLC